MLQNFGLALATIALRLQDFADRSAHMLHRVPPFSSSIVVIDQTVDRWERAQAQSRLIGILFQHIGSKSYRQSLAGSLPCPITNTLGQLRSPGAGIVQSRQ